MKRTVNIFNHFIIVFFAAAVVLGLCGAAANKLNTLPLPGLMVCLGAALCLGAAVGIGRIEKYTRNLSVYDYRRFTALLLIILFISQLITAIFVDFTPRSDLSYVCAGAKNLALGKDIYEGLPDYHQDYFECYPNNHMLFSVVYLLYKIQYALTGNITDFLPTALNIVGLSVSYWLMCRCAEMIHQPSKAYICAIRGMLFTPMITYSAFFYTDSMSMPFVMASAYFYLRYRNSGKISHIIFSGAFIGLGYKMKGSAVVLLIAVIIDMLIKKRNIKFIAALIMPCAAIIKAVSFAAMRLMNISCRALKEKAFPLIHWIMMSADGRGGYNSEDFFYTQSFSGCEKASADLSRLGEKLEAQGIAGFFGHLCSKAAYTWENITFMAGYYYDDAFRSPSFIITAFFCHFTLMFSILLSLVDSRKNGADGSFVFRLSLFGLCLFLLIWETRCRYLVSFFPLFMLI
ncbi:MAG: glycosyltransferase family 39 protein [Alistipes sp.]|nr:glycosyltransferase family 39 protein [Alistipes sp.]